MASSFVSMFVVFIVGILVGSSNAQLSTNFYCETCPQLFPTVRAVVEEAIAQEARMGASLLRLHFHDCFINGCDASNLLDDTPTMLGEKTAAPNLNSVRGFEVIDQIKSAVEQVCPGVVSCADILAIAAKDSVNILRGPEWEVKLGRRDAMTASFAAANSSNGIPPPSSNLSALISNFQSKGLSARDLVALYGAHTIGQARCKSFRPHIYNDTNIDPSYARANQAICPSNSGNGDGNLAPLDPQTPTTFDNTYYRSLVSKQSLLHSDQELYNGGSTDMLVQTYVSNPGAFSSDFITGMLNMGDIMPLTGSQGQIRTNCRRIN
ncbi:peroxidase 4-like [Silene latifolia]|uniref:peroxidase 4-like n=1 Tax=Silene latifolia TaxID=37657 RepID=UPI003D772DCF